MCHLTDANACAKASAYAHYPRSQGHPGANIDPPAASAASIAVAIARARRGASGRRAAGPSLRPRDGRGLCRKGLSYRATAQSAQKLGLLRPIEFRFHTVGFLVVTDVFPVPDSSDVSTESTIRITFNRPIVPLTAIQDQKHLLDPLEFSPAVPGKGTWTNTSIYTFEPEKRLLPGTEYTVRVSAGLEDTTGGILEKDYVWSFTKAIHVSPSTSITLTFNQPMDHQETQARLILSSGKDARAVRGDFTWQDNALTFTPSHPLDRGVLYDLRLEKGAPAATGGVSIAQTYDWQFETASLPVVTSIHPLHGEEEVPLKSLMLASTSSLPQSIRSL